MCSTNSSGRTLYTSFLTNSSSPVVYPVGSRNALFVVGEETVLLNTKEEFAGNISRWYYPQSFENITVAAGVTVTWYLDGSVATLTLNSSTNCPTGSSSCIDFSPLLTPLS